MTETEEFDIVKFIERNPLARLSGEYSNSLITKIKESFSLTQQHLFVASFYCFLNYNQETDLVVDLDNVWKWIGFSRKDHCKALLVKPGFCVEGMDYEITKATSAVAGEGGSGLLKQRIMMTVRTFKRLCLKAGTKTATEVHDYYLKLEYILQQLMDEQTEELREQLGKQKQLTSELHEQLTEQKSETKRGVEKVLIQSFETRQVVYVGTIGDIEGEPVSLAKFGCTDHVQQRIIQQHKKEIGSSFVLEYVKECARNRQLENLFKKHPEVIHHRVHRVINGKRQTELLQLTETFTIEHIKSIFESCSKQINQNYHVLKMKHDEKMVELEIDRLEKQRQCLQLQTVLTKEKSLQLELDILKEKNANIVLQHEAMERGQQMVLSSHVEEHKEDAPRAEVAAIVPFSNGGESGTFSKTKFLSISAEQRARCEEILRILPSFAGRKLLPIMRELHITPVPADQRHEKIRERINTLLATELVCIACCASKPKDQYRFRFNRFHLKCMECEVGTIQQPKVERSLPIQPEPKPGEEMHQCIKCDELLPVSAFFKKNGRKRGVQYECKVCTTRRIGGYEKVIKITKQPAGLNEDQKWCKVCDTVLNINCFLKVAQRPDGLSYSCRECHNAAGRRNRLARAMKRVASSV